MATPFRGRAVVLRTEPRSTGSSALRASIPVAGSDKARLIRSACLLNRRLYEAHLARIENREVAPATVSVRSSRDG